MKTSRCIREKLGFKFSTTCGSIFTNIFLQMKIPYNVLHQKGTLTFNTSDKELHKNIRLCFWPIHTKNTHLIVGPCIMIMNLMIKKKIWLYIVVNIEKCSSQLADCTDQVFYYIWCKCRYLFIVWWIVYCTHDFLMKNKHFRGTICIYVINHACIIYDEYRCIYTSNV